jgi:hypothetical protein
MANHGAYRAVGRKAGDRVVAYGQVGHLAKTGPLKPVRMHGDRHPQVGGQ